MDSGDRKDDFSGRFLFSLLAGAFCAAVVGIAELLLTLSGSWKPAGLGKLLLLLCGAFIFGFGATLSAEYWSLSYWFMKDQMSGRVGPWQKAPRWFNKLMNLLLKDERGGHDHQP